MGIGAGLARSFGFKPQMQSIQGRKNSTNKTKGGVNANS